MRISLVAAIGHQGQLGYQGKLPWRLPKDLKKFKELTWGGVMIMGRKTFESLPGPLPGRISVVVSRQEQLKLADGVIHVKSLEEAFERCRKEKREEIFVVGGGEIYTQALPQAQRLYLSKVDYSGPFDTVFPEVNWREWKEINKESFAAENENTPAWSFSIFDRRI